MALKLNEKYPGYMNAPSIDYPQGSFKNRTSPTAEDGSYFDQDWANDDQGFKQSLLSAAGVTANGQVDKVGSSQYFDALKTVISKESPKTEFATQSEFDAHTSKTKVVSPFVMQPSATGSAVLTGLNNNIYFAGIVAALGLEKGDVIRVVAGSYNKLHTVESLTDSNNIVVNYEHCGLRGNGSLKLQDYNGSVTITRVVKWHSAAPGLGQAWVLLTSFRAHTATYQNSTNREILVECSHGLYPDQFGWVISGLSLGDVGSTTSGVTGASLNAASVPQSASYSLRRVSGTFLSWVERR